MNVSDPSGLFGEGGIPGFAIVRSILGILSGISGVVLRGVFIGIRIATSIATATQAIASSSVLIQAGQITLVSSLLGVITIAAVRGGGRPPNWCIHPEKVIVGRHCVGPFRLTGAHHPHQQAARNKPYPFGYGAFYNRYEALAVQGGTFDHGTISRIQQQLNGALRRTKTFYDNLDEEETVQRQAMGYNSNQAFSDVEIEAILVLSRASLVKMGPTPGGTGLGCLIPLNIP